MKKKIINIAKDFSRYPTGRYIQDGPYSGERFRKEILIPALKDSNNISIEFDGTRGYGSSFLEEAFGGTVRSGFSAEKLLKALTFITEDESLKDEISDYIKEAE